MWKRLDDAWANVEAALAIGMLLFMIVVAFMQAFLRNLTQYGATWANTLLEELDWADFVLSKGTLWVAFLGASLAVHADKHVAIDIAHRFVSPRVRMLMRSVVGFIGAVACAFLAKAFWSAVAVNGTERPAEFELITAEGSKNLCDASSQELAEAGVSKRPYCYVRSFLSLFGAGMETPGAAFQLVVPVMFAVMAVRFFGIGVRDLRRFINNDVEDDPSTHGLTGAAHEVADDISHHGGN